MKKNTKTFLSICLGIVLFLSGSLLSIARELEPKGEKKSEGHFFLSNKSTDDGDDPDDDSTFDELWEADYEACIEECNIAFGHHGYGGCLVEITHTGRDNCYDLIDYVKYTQPLYFSCLRACDLIYDHD